MVDTLQVEALSRSRARIADKVRELRRARHMTQQALADRLGLSQSRLSEIERGGGSFTAEQFLELLRLFNVDVGDFEDADTSDDASMQNALIRHGATHLRQASGAAVSSRYRTPADVVIEVLLDPHSERFVTALAPVLVANCEVLSLPAVQRELSNAGRPNRLPWLLDNIVQALEELSREAGAPPRPDTSARRATLVLTEFLAHLPESRDRSEARPRDTFDQGIRTEASLDRTWETASPVSRRWSIVSAIQPADFVDALRQAHESD